MAFELKKVDRHVFFSIALHVALALLMFGSIAFEASRPRTVLNPVLKKPDEIKEQKPEEKVIQAGLVDHKMVNKAMERQVAEEKKRQQALQAQKRQAELAKQRAEKLRKEAEALKKKAAELKRQTEEEQKRAKLEAEKTRLAKAETEKALAKAKQAKKLEAEAKAKAALQQKRIEENKKKVAAEKAAALKRAKAAEQAAKAKQQAAAHQTWVSEKVDVYKAQIQQQILDNRTLTAAFGSELVCEIEIRLLPDGSVNSVRVIKSSGNEAYDNSAEVAVYKAAPFEMPPEPELVNELRHIVFGFKNDEQTIS